MDPKKDGLHPDLFDPDLLGIAFMTVWEAGLIFRYVYATIDCLNVVAVAAVRMVKVKHSIIRSSIASLI